MTLIELISTFIFSFIICFLITKKLIKKESSKNITMSHGDDTPQPKKPVTKDKKPGRNDLCPCGSGKKYKQCCGK